MLPRRPHDRHVDELARHLDTGSARSRPRPRRSPAPRAGGRPGRSPAPEVLGSSSRVLGRAVEVDDVACVSRYGTTSPRCRVEGGRAERIDERVRRVLSEFIVTTRSCPDRRGRPVPRPEASSHDRLATADEASDEPAGRRPGAVPNTWPAAIWASSGPGSASMIGRLSVVNGDAGRLRTERSRHGHDRREALAPSATPARSGSQTKRDSPSRTERNHQRPPRGRPPPTALPCRSSASLPILPPERPGASRKIRYCDRRRAYQDGPADGPSARLGNLEPHRVDGISAPISVEGSGVGRATPRRPGVKVAASVTTRAIRALALERTHRCPSTIVAPWRAAALANART
jgi:hypothetical protein